MKNWKANNNRDITPMPAPIPKNTTEMYLRWRDSIMPREADFYEVLENMSFEELSNLFTTSIPGFAAERLNPSNSKGDFHFARGVIKGLMYAKAKQL